MKLFGFIKRKPIEAPAPADNRPTAQAAVPHHHRRATPEEWIAEGWAFPPNIDITDRRVFSHESIVAACAIAIARSVGSLAEDVAAIRKHVTRLQLVHERHEAAGPTTDEKP